MTLKGRDFLKIEDLNREELYSLISKSLELKRSPEKAGRPLEGGSVALVFHKPSMRTRVSFEAAAASLGACPIFLRRDEVGMGERESIADIGKVLARYVEAIVVRTFAQSIVEELAESSDKPVINALTDEEHPCQALADLMTVIEKKERAAGVKVAYVGDGDNNVATSLMLAGAMMGMEISIASPECYKPNEEAVERAARLGKASNGKVEITTDPSAAVDGADVVYTDVWTSMGQEKEREERLKAFKGFQIDFDLLSKAKKDAIFMHCLPAHRGEEVAEGVMESKYSVVFDQAENRLHTAKAVLYSLIGG